ncbi:MAG: NAD-dependent deacylase [Bacteriovoracaceae bacterium]|nr:NAD-dependent deacylase [Bacteriovoracaceae bacterium]
MEIDLTKVKNIVFLTGAGISQESGIKTFRDQDGLWENHSIQEVACPKAYARDPNLVHRFYNLRRAQLHEVEPNPAHKAIGALSKCKNFNVSVITQNVDDLHERGGAKKVLHMHGELRRIRNNETGQTRYFEGQVPEEQFQIWRPDIVWFGEDIKCGDKIPELIGQADLFIAVGTSSQVYPAAGFVSMANFNQIPTVELNLEKTQMSQYYTTTFQGKASMLVPEFIQTYLGIKI